MTLCGEGVGGRCQELALSAALCLGYMTPCVFCVRRADVASKYL